MLDSYSALCSSPTYIGSKLIHCDSNSFPIPSTSSNNTCNCCFVFTVTSFPYPIQRALRIVEKDRVEMFNSDFFDRRTQDLEEAYHDAGQFYWGRATAFKDELSIYSGSTLPYILPRHLVQDIDTVEDWVRAEAMYKLLQTN